MAWVERLVTRTTQPQDACGLNTSHPLFSKINLAWTPKSQIFVAGQSGKSVQSSAASPVVSAGTRGVFENQGQNGIEIPVSRVQANNGFSVLYIGGHSSPDWSVCLETSSGVFRRWGGLYTLITPSGRRTVSSSSIPAGAVVVAGMLNIATYRMVVNGASVVNQDLSGGDSIGPNRPAQVFQVAAGGRSSATYWNSPSALLVGFDTYLSEADVNSLTANPWQIFEPEVTRIWVDDYVSTGGGATTVTTDASATYTIAGAAQSDSAAQYQISSVVTADAAASYAVRGSTAIDASASYTVAGSVQADAAASYKIASAVQQDATAQYAIRAAVTADASASYSQIAASSVTADASASYVVQGAVQQDAAASYAVRAAVFADAVASYALIVDGQVTADVSASYQIRGAVQSDASLAYEIAGAVQSSASAGYVVQGMASADASAAYVVQGAVVADAAGSYLVDGEYVPSTTPGARTRPSRLQSSSRPSRLQTGTRASR